MKKFYFLFLLMLLPLVAIAGTVEINGIYYKLISKAKQAEVTSNPNKYTGKVVIPKTITYKSVKYSVTSVGESAFRECSGLTSVTIPTSVISIGEYAFKDCSELTSVTIPSSVTSIGNDAFWGCCGLTSMTIPSSVTSIGEFAFRDCCNMKSVTIPNSVTDIGQYAFSGCGLTSVTIPNSVTSIEMGTFFGCYKLASVTIPNSVTNIGWQAFYGCNGLKKLTIPNSVTTIESEAFSGCIAMTSVTIPNSITSIGQYTFSGCGLTSVTIPNSVTNIGSSAFAYCSKMTTVTIGKGIETISSTAFANCEELTDVYCYAENVPNTESDAFENSYPEYITLRVPVGSLDAYKAAKPWSKFKSKVKITAKVSLSKTEVDVEKGKTVTLKATVTPSTLLDKSVTWKSSNTKIATVTSSGKVKGVKAGTATITCTSKVSGTKATCKVTVTEGGINGAVTLNKTEAYIEKSKTMTLKATLTPTDLEDKSVTWTSSDTKIATVSSGGKVKGVKYGTATITCTSNATGASATCKVTIGKVVINMPEFTLKKSRTVTLEATVYPTSLTDKSVTWTSSDTKVATVSSSGKVKGIAAGTATITCTSVATGLKGTCTVTVLATSETRSTDGDDDDDTIGIEMMEDKSAIAEPYDVYDLSGRKVRNQVTSLDGLPNGIYIVNGKKMLKK